MSLTIDPVDTINKEACAKIRVEEKRKCRKRKIRHVNVKAASSNEEEIRFEYR